MQRLKMNYGETVSSVFEHFLSAKAAIGAVDKTLATYRAHFSAMSKHFDNSISIDELQLSHLNKMIESLRGIDLSANTIKSYSITMRAFINWCNKEGLTNINFKAYKGGNSVVDTYSKKELELLLVKPKMKTCTFSEYRNWVIINLLLNSGCRASTLRNIQIRDVDLNNKVIYARHTKNKSVLAMPMCEEMSRILHEYLNVRRGKESDYLFCNAVGEQLSESCLRQTISKYNKKRGVEKTSIHMFRHTFAKIYLLECGGNAFTLQKLLGHSSLDVTKKYCSIFDSEISKGFDAFSPLTKIKSSQDRIKMNQSRSKKVT